MAKMVNATFAYQKKKTGDVNNSGNLAFAMFTIYYYPQYLYLQGANLCTSIFLSHEGDANRVK